MKAMDSVLTSSYDCSRSSRRALVTIDASDASGKGVAGTEWDGR